MSEPGYLRIGELARRSGVSPELLRAWERRYALLRPARSQGGFRLYTAADEARIRRMRDHLARGVAAAEAARLAVDAEVPGPGAEVPEPPVPATEATAAPPPLQAAAGELALALDRFQEEQAHGVLDRLLAAYRIETVLRELLIPYLHDLGERWARGEVTVAQEHFAANLLRGRLLGLARGWGQGRGPAAVLACLPGEQHDLGLIAFGLVLRARGWRIVYLGPDAPIDTVEDACRQLQPGLVVLHAVTDEHVQHAVEPLRALAGRHRVALGGAAAASGAPVPNRVQLLTGDLIAEATLVTTLVQDAQ